MIDAETFIDTPSEPHVHMPKSSMISRQATRHRVRNNNYQDITPISSLGKAKFPVYLVKSQNKNFAMKVFPLLEEDESVHPYFENEIRFSSFSHPNIIKIAHFENNREFFHNGNSQKIAFILMEYAPHGDLFTFSKQYQSHFAEKLVRTYFRQLIEGLEYFHSRGAVHLDIKLDNLLLDKNFNLKIADFDMSGFTKDLKTLSKGTKFYRAPELKSADYKISHATDIYSAGITLFVLKSGGVLPHSEEIDYKGINLYDLLNNNASEFWKTHCKIQNKEPAFFDDDFKDLFLKMVKVNPEDRAAIKEIKRSKWYNGPVYDDETLKRHIQTFFNS